MEKSKVLLNVLCLEDELKDAELLNEILVDAGYLVNMDIAAEGKEYLSFLKGRNYDIILSDYTLPGFDVHSALKLALELQPEVPFICASGTISEDKAVELLKLGATDYVLKDRLGRLAFAVRQALEGVANQKKWKKAEEAILQSEKNFRRSISESPIGIRIVSVDGKTIYANKVFLDIYEFNSLEEFTSTPAINRYTPESYAQHQVRKEKRKNGREVFDYETSIVRKNAEIRHVKVLRKEVLWNGIKHYQVINIDITEQKKLTLDLIAAKGKAEESDRLKSAFLANMSHEVRTPLNSIIGFSELLADPDFEEEQKDEFIQHIITSGNNLLSIISDIMDISKMESGEITIRNKQINVRKFILTVTEKFSSQTEAKKLELKLTLPDVDEETFIFADVERLRQIFNNLMSNAIKFTANGSIEIGYQPKGKMVEFFIRDTGIGIPAEYHKVIFERFRQVEADKNRKFGGNGLGLAITKNLVELMGGEIWLESDPDSYREGKGSVFYFTLPTYNCEI